MLGILTSVPLLAVVQFVEVLRHLVAEIIGVVLRVKCRIQVDSTKCEWRGHLEEATVSRMRAECRHGTG